MHPYSKVKEEDLFNIIWADPSKWIQGLAVITIIVVVTLITYIESSSAANAAVVDQLEHKHTHVKLLHLSIVGGHLNEIFSASGHYTSSSTQNLKLFIIPWTIISDCWCGHTMLEVTNDIFKGPAQFKNASFCVASMSWKSLIFHSYICKDFVAGTPSGETWIFAQGMM